MQIPNTIHILGFTGNPDATNRTIKEVERAGFRAEPFWCFPNPFTDFLASRLPVCRMMAQKHSFLNCSLGHYNLWKSNRELGRCPLFIVEDDCRFLKDIDLVHKTLANHPADADMLLLDSFGPVPHDGVRRFVEERKNVRDGWAKVSRARSMACYIVTERMADRLIALTEGAVHGKIMRACDQWVEAERVPGMNMYCAVPNLAIQQMSPDFKSRSSADGNVWKYKAQGTEHGLYADW